MDLLYLIPAPLMLLIALCLACAAALGMQVIIHARFGGADFVAHNELGGVMIVVAASLYAVLLGFLTVIAWEHFQEARSIVVLESAASIDAWHTAVGLPDPVRQRVRDDMSKYADDMVTREWSLMRHGQYDPSAAMLSMDAIDAVGGLIPQNLGQANAQSATLQQLGVLHDARQRRIAANEGGISAFEWMVLSLGALCIICFCWLFGGRRQAVHLIMTATVVIVIISMLVLLFELQDPFRSNVRVSAQPWEDAIAHIKEMRGGGLMDMRK